MPKREKTLRPQPPLPPGGERESKEFRFLSTSQVETPESPVSSRERGLGGEGHQDDQETFSLGRRSFLQAAGFTLTGALATGCTRAPVEKAIPFLVQPEEVVPGRSLRYAATCGGCTAGCGVLLGCRDGRPIKVEGNGRHPLSQGGVCAVGQAALLGLYDSQRLSAPLLAGETATWAALDEEVGRRLDEIAAAGGRLRLLTETVHSPTELAWIGRFLARFPDARHVVYDPLSCAAIPRAHALTHGAPLLPRYLFQQAEVIVSFDADFLGTWISPVEHTAGYRAGRLLDGEPPRLSHHVQVEGRLSLTGSNADRRIVAGPQESSRLLEQLARLVAALAGADLGESLVAQQHAQEGAQEGTQALAGRLWQARGRALVVCGSQRLRDQILTNLLNHLLGAYGTTLDLERPSRQRLGDDGALAELIDELQAGAVSALLIRGVNPVYDLPAGAAFAAALEQVPLVVSFASHRDETAGKATVVCPDHHPMESWRDGEPVPGLLSVTQPGLRPLGQTRAFSESLATWAGESATALELMRRVWEAEIYPRRGDGAATSFQRFWDGAVHDGFVEVAAAARPAAARPAAAFDLSAARKALADATETVAGDAGELTLILYPKVALLDGRHAENPFLQELPDPITKVVWDNYACLSPRTASQLGLESGDVVRIHCPPEEGEGAGQSLELPVLELPALVQPGQHDGIVAVALGYGREGTQRFVDLGPRWLQGRRTVEAGDTVGRNGAPLGRFVDGLRQAQRPGVRIEATGARHALASTQTYHQLEVPAALAPASGEPRPIVQETTLAAYSADRGAGAPHAHAVAGNLWPEHPYAGYHWGMAIDLNACTGCSACIVACQVENNVPVVGKDEVARRRDMHWLRIDRYYQGEGDRLDVMHQPMLCHHCDNAPCETVCPVLATVHSAEGLNQQVYNRCVGTRYCANNCPFKVRRFNWFNYPREDRLENLALNPDVVVRSRGVMEKCSFCVQRIQEAKHKARLENRPVADGEIQTACQQSCPAQAITFGDAGDATSRVAALAADPRHYRLLEELNILPSVGYLRRVRHRDGGEESEKEVHHG